MRALSSLKFSTDLEVHVQNQLKLYFTCDYTMQTYKKPFRVITWRQLTKDKCINKKTQNINIYVEQRNIIHILEKGMLYFFSRFLVLSFSVL